MFKAPFLSNTSLYTDFSWTSLKKLNFSVNTHSIKFFILNPTSYLLKVTKLLSKILQFKFLVMTDKNIFVYKLFLSWIISDFIVYFLCKNCNPLWKKSPPPFPQPTRWKLRSCEAHLFWKFGRRLKSPSAERGGCTLWSYLWST